MSKKNSLHTAMKAEIKQLRSDARKLRVIAKHLSDRAKQLSAEIKMDENAEKARANFYSKKSEIEPGVVLTPDMPEKPEKLFEEGDKE